MLADSVSQSSVALAKEQSHLIHHLMSAKITNAMLPLVSTFFSSQNMPWTPHSIITHLAPSWNSFFRTHVFLMAPRFAECDSRTATRSSASLNMAIAFLSSPTLTLN